MPVSPTPPAARLLPEGIERLATRIDAEIASHRLPGAVIVIADRRDVLYARAFGRLTPARDTPMPLDALFRIYSMTKPLTSVAALMLMEEGRLLLSDPVTRFLPEFSQLSVGVEVADGQGGSRLERHELERPMTIIDLLRHTAGLTYGIFGDSAVKREYLRSGFEGRLESSQDLVRRLAELPLAHQPGTVWEYSRATDLLGALIERVADRPFQDVLAERILRPLGMVDTDFWVDAARLERVAEPFTRDPETGEGVRLFNVAREPGFRAGGGGLVSTAADYLRFAQVLANGGALGGIRLLAPATLRLMTSDHLDGLPAATTGDYLPGPGYGFGLGVAVRTAPAALVPGQVGDYNWSGLGGTYFWIDPASDLIAICLAQAPGQRAYYRQLLRTLIYSALAA